MHDSHDPRQKSGKPIRMWAVGQASGVMVSRLRPALAYLGTTDEREWRTPLIETERGLVGDPGEHRYICYQFAEMLAGLTRKELQEPRRIVLRVDVLK